MTAPDLEHWFTVGCNCELKRDRSLLGTATCMVGALMQAGFSPQLAPSMAAMPGRRYGFLTVSVIASSCSAGCSRVAAVPWFSTGFL